MEQKNFQKDLNEKSLKTKILIDFHNLKGVGLLKKLLFREKLTIKSSSCDSKAFLRGVYEPFVSGRSVGS
jgi:HKD family nuclease